MVLLVTVVGCGSVSALPVQVSDGGTPEVTVAAGEPKDDVALGTDMVGVSVQTPVEVPVDVDTDLPLSGVTIGLGEGADDATVSNKDGTGSAVGKPGIGVDDIPPAALAVGGATIFTILAGAAVSGLFSRIEGPAVLTHPTRARLLALVTEQPGLTIQRVQELLGTAWGTTVHHVRRLETNGHIASVRQGPRTLLYAANSPQAKARRDLALIRNETARQVARLVAGTPGIRTTALSTSLGIATPSASKHLSRFAAAGLVEHPEAGGFVATDRLHQALALA